MKRQSRIREVSTLSFNERVLQEAEDPRNPLMERVKFLGIFSSNMDEFFKVRVASIHRRIEMGKRNMESLLDQVVDKSRELDERFRAAYREITAALEREGMRILTADDIAAGSELAGWLRDYFRTRVLPNLVPIIIQPSRPFPQLTDGALYFAIKMTGVVTRYAVLKIPKEAPRFVELPTGDIMYVDDLIRYSLDDIFYIFDYERIEAHEFKLSRDAELDTDNDFSEGYIQRMERELEQRKGGRPTRLAYGNDMPLDLLNMLVRELDITEDEMHTGGGRYHNMKDLMGFPNHRPDLSFEPLRAQPHPVLDAERRPILDLVDSRDILVTYPYQSFDHLVRLLRESAIDPHVDEIKMTIYRAAKNSQVVNALVNAARNGKRIVVSIELLARFDEENNIQIAEKLDEVGATVLYGVPPMKTHGKLLLIRRKGRLVAGLSTGNFNESTGRLYVDSLLMTADRRITEDVDTVFGFLERAARMRIVTPPRFRHLLVSPFNARTVFTRLLAREKAKGKKGYVLIKANHLTDSKMIRQLTEAAEAGVKMDCIVRTTYSVPPHDHIRAISILDRYLEHQRIYIFGKGADRRVYLSSSDLMERNLDWRVEVAFPVLDAQLQQQVVDLMDIQVRDNVKARRLDADQTNPYVDGSRDAVRAQYETHAYFERLARQSGVKP